MKELQLHKLSVHMLTDRKTMKMQMKIALAHFHPLN